MWDNSFWRVHDYARGVLLSVQRNYVRFARTNSGLCHSSKRAIVRSLSKIKDVFYLVYRRFWRGLCVPRRRSAGLSAAGCVTILQVAGGGAEAS